MDSPNRIARLIVKHWTNELSEEERKELNKWRTRSDENQELFEELTADQYGYKMAYEDLINSADAKFKENEQAYNLRYPAKPPEKKVKMYATAACILLLITSATFYTYISFSTKINFSVPNTSHNDNKVEIHLTDGTIVSPDSIFQRLPNQGNCEVLFNDSVIIYTMLPGDQAEPQKQSFNYISTTGGSQYMVQLPDGSKVWLNAASSICIPVSYCSSRRNVEITGEAYFDIKSIYSGTAKQPFIIDVNGPIGLHQRVQVFGTRFNINAYCDEPFIKTTLLEGCIAVAGGRKSTFLIPGQELQLGKENIKIFRQPAMDEVIAWKDDFFVFSNASPEHVLREIGRWYGKRIVFRGNSCRRINLKMPRSLNFQSLLLVIRYLVDDCILIQEGDCILQVKKA